MPPDGPGTARCPACKKVFPTGRMKHNEMDCRGCGARISHYVCRPCWHAVLRRLASLRMANPQKAFRLELECPGCNAAEGDGQFTVYLETSHK